MHSLAPLCVAVPLLGAALLSGIGRFLPRLLGNLITLTVVLAVNVMTVWLVVSTAGGRVVTWVGGWTPRHGTSVGIVLVVDRAGAGMATLAAAMTLAALVFSWEYLGGPEPLAHTLMLVFLAGMCGLALTGDLFDLFVFFELMSVAAYALTAWKSEEPQSQQGALTFGIINSLGAYLTLSGIALVYARTGELGLAQIGRQLRAHPDPAFTAAALALVLTGFLVKAAVTPFHFWIADAHAVAPTPICILFSGVMVELGLFGIVRIWFDCFQGTLPEAAVRHLLLTLGVLTAAVGTVMCVVQPSIKRLLAFSTAAHLGLLMAGVAVLDDDALAGGALYLLSHSAAKAALFIAAGILLNRYASVDQRELHGRGRRMPVTSTLFLLGGLALADLPPFGTAAGKGILEDAAAKGGHGWLWLVFLAVSAGTGGAVLAVWARVFRGWGRPDPIDEGEETHLPHEEPDAEDTLGHVPLTMGVPAAVLLVAALLGGCIPDLGHRLANVGAQLRDVNGYAASALDSARAAAVAHGPVPLWTTAGVGADALSVLLAVAVAAVVVRRTDNAWTRAFRQPVLALRRLHSGHVGDYVAWLAIGVTAAFALLRTG